MHHLPLLRPGGPYRSLDQRVVRDYTGAPLATVSQAPPLLARLALEELRAGPPSGAAALWPILKVAGRRLAHETVAGEPPEQYLERVCRTTGAPWRWAKSGIEELAAALTSLDAAVARQVPGGDPLAVDTGRPAGEEHAWVRRGQVLAFIAPGNHAATHFTWALALALGWRLAVRPAATDPFTPWRLAMALHEAGLPPGHLALLSGGHSLVPLLCAAADRTIVYGGDEITQAYAGRQEVLVNGPGRSRVYVDLAHAPETEVLAEFLADCILHDGGRKCTATSALVLRGDATPLLAAVARRLAAIPLLDPLDPAALAPAWPEPAAAQAVAATLAAAGTAGDADLTAALRSGPLLQQVAGATLLAPTLVHCRKESPLFAREWPAPICPAVVLDPADDPLPWLRGALAVTLVGAPAALAEQALREPSIGKVFTGLIPTWHSEPGAPHNGRLSDFLFVRKAASNTKEGDPTWT